MGFNIGDRVRGTDKASHGAFGPGDTGTVVLVSSSTFPYKVRKDGSTEPGPWSLSDGELELVTPELPFPVGTRVFVDEKGSNIGTHGGYVGAGTVTAVGHSPKLYRVVEFDNDTSPTYKASIYCFIEHISLLTDQVKPKAGDTVRILTDQFAGFSTGDFSTIESVDEEGSSPYYFVYRCADKRTTPLIEGEFEVVSEEEREAYEAEERGKLLVEAYWAAYEAREAAETALRTIRDALPEAFETKGD